MTEPRATIHRDPDGRYYWRLEAGGIMVDSERHPTQIRAHEELDRFLDALWVKRHEA